MKKIESTILSKVIRKRESSTHKGDYGRILLIGGSSNYGGAILMAAEGALNSGAGLLCVATHSLNVTALHARNPEIMFIDWRDQRGLMQLIPQMDVVVCGMGLGNDDFAKKLLAIVRDNITSEQTLILDASALDLISQDRQLLPSRAKNLILTPHQMEWQRLSQIRIPYQDDSSNQTALKKLVPQQTAYLILKSNHTKIYSPEGEVLENQIGNPGMATGGMGDTLAGIIGGFCCQFGTNFDTIAAAVYIHSLAGDVINQTDYVVRPTKVSALLPKLMKKYQA